MDKEHFNEISKVSHAIEECEKILNAKSFGDLVHLTIGAVRPTYVSIPLELWEKFLEIVKTQKETYEKQFKQL